MNTRRPTVPAAEEVLDLYFPVLDHGFVALKDYMSGDDGVEEAARTSYAYGNRSASEQANLLRSLKRRGHTSPFEQMELKFHCAMPLFVARQWIRTRMASVNEVSGRYSILPMLFYTPEEEQIRAQSKKDKQGRDQVLDPSIPAGFRDQLQKHRTQVDTDYTWATENDIARELARIDLPLSTYTSWYWKVDGHNLMHTLGLRCDEHAQWETRQYFNVIAGLFKRVAPISFQAWLDYDFYGRHFSQMEMKVIREGVKHVSTTDSELFFLGLTKTEVQEFRSKLEQPSVQSFDLDLSQARTGEDFQKHYTENLPGKKT